MTRWVPDNAIGADALSAPRYLDAMALTSPAIALSNATLETARMCEVLGHMFDTALAAFRQNSTEDVKQLKSLDERLNVFQSSIQAYLVDLNAAKLSPEDARRALDITLYVSNLEHAGDIIHLNLSDRIRAKAHEDISFSKDEQLAFDELCRIIHDNIKLAAGVMASGDLAGAKRLIARKDVFRQLENTLLDQHFRGDRAMKRQTLRNSALFVDMIRDLHRINSHIVSAGYPIVEAAGLLRGSRLRNEAKANP
jgi:phosphate:Na+ symporter